MDAASLSLVLTIALGYLCGSLPCGLWLGRWFRGVDVRTLGSGNLGATNVYRSLGPAARHRHAAARHGQGRAAGVAGARHCRSPTAFPGGPEWCALAVGLAAVLGHVWTFLAGFRGGKGVATTAGVLLALAAARVR